jgi:[acyl-carrier-protein] S-malonyltransferase
MFDQRVGVVCPGHGGEHPGMRTLVAARRPDLLALAQTLLDSDPFERLKEGTAYIQPAVYCATLAGWEIVRNEAAPIAVAGHSLGEIAAAVIGGAISAEDGLRLAVSRGRACQQAADASPGGMLVVRATLERASALAAEYNLIVANDNAPDQVVLAGDADHLDILQREAQRLGVATLALPTRVPFHTAAMLSATELLREVLASIDVSPPKYVVYCAASAAPFRDIREELALALVRPVRWRDTTLALLQRGATCFLDIGPGRTLARLTRRTVANDASVSALEDLRPLN